VNVKKVLIKETAIHKNSKSLKLKRDTVLSECKHISKYSW